jgi:hypothetical protein
MTILAVVTQGALVGGCACFGCISFVAGTFSGWAFYETLGSDSRIYHLRGDGTLPNVGHIPPPGLILASNKHVVCATVETTPRWLIQGARGTAAWNTGAMAPCVYDTAVVPSIGATATLALWIGHIYYLCLIRGALSNDDLAFYSRLLMDGVKPFAWR